MSFIGEFKEFAMRGSVLDMAIGIIIGAAFGKIVTSLVNDIIMPPLGMIIGDVDFNNLFISLSGGEYSTLSDAQAAGAVTINYGIFINTIVDFVLVAFAIFLLIREVNKMRKPAAAAPAPATKECPFCLSIVPLKATRCPSCTSQLS